MQNVRWLLLVSPLVASVVVFLLGSSVQRVAPEDLQIAVSSARTWLLIFAVLFAINAAVAWFFRHRFAISAARMLVSGLFAYIAISALVPLGAVLWKGAVPPDTPEHVAQAMRAAYHYAAVCWSVSLVTAALGVAIHFEDCGLDAVQSDSGDSED